MGLHQTSRQGERETKRETDRLKEGNTEREREKDGLLTIRFMTLPKAPSVCCCETEGCKEREERSSRGEDFVNEQQKCKPGILWCLVMITHRADSDERNIPLS